MFFFQKITIKKNRQNIFYSKESFSVYSWKFIPTIKNHKELPKLIVVGIDNAQDNRLNEYAHWITDVGTTPETAPAGGDGMTYSDWVVNTVKPFIDKNYRTKTDRQNTLLGVVSVTFYVFVTLIHCILTVKSIFKLEQKKGTTLMNNTPQI